MRSINNYSKLIGLRKQMQIKGGKLILLILVKIIVDKGFSRSKDWRRKDL
jgi:hypothetical protein